MARPPVDPRLWRYAHSARRYLLLSVALSVVITGSIVVTAVALARVLAGILTDPGQRSLGSWSTEMVVLGSAVAVRVVATWVQSRLAHRAGATVVSELEGKVLAAGARLSPRELETRRTELAVVVSTGLTGLRGYLVGYLPALLLAVLVPPVVLAVIAVHDPISGGIAAVTLPLIPVFMVLIGFLTEGRAEATLAATTRLSDQLLDLFAGMPTLRALGREGGSASVAVAGPPRSMESRVRELGDALRQRTMRALRIAFLSSMVLELLATLSVALIAVSIGLRLVYGGMALYAGLVALILAPEVYLPLRMVGERFHAAQDGMAAADKAFAILEPKSATVAHGVAGRTAGDCDVIDDEGFGADDAREGLLGVGSAHRASARARDGRSRAGDADIVDCGAMIVRAAVVASDHVEWTLRGQGDEYGNQLTFGTIELRALSVAAREGFAPGGLSAVLRPGAITVLAGPNGSGKSTAVQAILGLIEPDAGKVTVGGIDVRDIDRDQWWAQVAWLPQRPVLVPGTLRENLELLGARTSGGTLADTLESACIATGFDSVLDELPLGWDTVVGAGGVGLSLGQRQRMALTRVLAADRPVILLDEPTAHLDPDSEAAVLTALKYRARAGATVVIIGHRPTVLAAADHLVHVNASTHTLAAAVLE